MNLKKGKSVIKIFKVGAIETGAVRTVARVGKGWVQLDGDDSLKYDPATGQEIDPAPGFQAAGVTSRLIEVDGE